MMDSAIAFLLANGFCATDEDPEDGVSCVDCGHVNCLCLIDEAADEGANA